MKGKKQFLTNLGKGIPLIGNKSYSKSPNQFFKGPINDNLRRHSRNYEHMAETSVWMFAEKSFYYEL